MTRLPAALIAAIALLALVAQFRVSQDLMGSPGWPTVLWRMAGYFTVLTNGLVAASFLAQAVCGFPIPAAWSAGLTLWIAAVGLVYHLVLAGIWSPEGAAWWADQGLHSAVPALVLIWWLALADKSQLRPGHALLWLVWPGLYCAYALIRGATSGFYPYPFIDVAALGAGPVAVNIALLILAFALAGLGLVAYARGSLPSRSL